VSWMHRGGIDDGRKIFNEERHVVNMLMNESKQ